MTEDARAVELILARWHTDGFGYLSEGRRYRVQENEDGIPGWVCCRNRPGSVRTRYPTLLAALLGAESRMLSTESEELTAEEERYWRRQR